MAKKVDFLVSRKNGSYAFRCRYPLDLAHLFADPFRWVSLETRSVVQAKVLVRANAADFDRKWSAYAPIPGSRRTGCFAKRISPPLPNASPPQPCIPTK
ncbi:MAG TPA: DUF6538 domain-containing protein [Burkholderiales bacterium]|nr:DUF6538 domain-containing protein [Burkholderiales bacterium]